MSSKKPLLSERYVQSKKYVYFLEDNSCRELDTLSKRSVKLTKIGMNLFPDTLREISPAYSQKMLTVQTKEG